MESGDCIKREEIDTDETDSDWFGYACKSEEILFYYNIKTGEHIWATNSSGSENTIHQVRTSNVPPKPNELCSVATQTEDYGCVNHCTSMYVDNEQQMENRESDSNEIKKDDDTVDVNKQNTLNNTDVDDNLGKISGDVETDGSFSTIITRVKHHQRKRKTTIHKCHHCIKTFKRKCHLDIHIRTHTGEKSYKCSYCDKAFSRKDVLDIHLRTHTGEKPYECSQCYKAFTTKSQLKNHLRTHTGEKPYDCSYCDKGFAQKSNLKVHLRTHTGEKPHKCSYCDKAFAWQGDLVRHIRTHTKEKPFECSYCDKGFALKRNLKDHLRIHTGQKPFECSHCNKAFAHKNSLIVHFRTHASEKPNKI